MTAAGLVTALAVLRDLALAATVGGLLAFAAVVPARSPGSARAIAVARWGSASWAVASVAFALASYASISQRTPSEPTFGSEAWWFLTSIPLGQVYLQVAIAAVLTSVAAGFVRTRTHAAWCLAPVVWGLAALALTGHAAGSADHQLAISAMFLHVASASAWVGVVLVVVAGARLWGDDAGAVLDRAGQVATWSAIVVLASGVANASLRFDAVSELWTSRYGRILLAKLAAIGAVILVSEWHRRGRSSRMAAAPGARAVWRAIAVEGAFMVVIIGLAGVLAGSAPPATSAVIDSSPAYLLTGYALPPAPTPATWFGLWRLEPIVALAIGAAAFTYGRWVVRLRSRGDTWPWQRTLAWFAGLALLAWTTQGAPAVYGLVTFSGHMVEHMFLVMVVPVPLALGAPVTLALRALPVRADGSRGPREWLRATVDSRLLSFLANPVVAAVNFAGSMFVFYYTPVFGWVLRNHVGHVWMVVHFVAAGYFFVNALVGVDPGPKRPVYPLRVVLLFATMAFHAFFGVALMSATALLVPRWFGLMGRDWGPSALVDQQVGGQLAWGIGEIPVVLLAIGVVWAWRKDDARAARRSDRQADRDDDAELRRYNEMLARLEDADRT